MNCPELCWAEVLRGSRSTPNLLRRLQQRDRLCCGSKFREELTGTLHGTTEGISILVRRVGPVMAAQLVTLKVLHVSSQTDLALQGLAQHRCRICTLKEQFAYSAAGVVHAV